MNELEFYNQQFEKYKQYDRNRTENNKLNLEQAEDYFEHLVRLYSNLESTLVDLGCGDGYFTSKLSPLNNEVIGIEPSSLINAANDLLKSQKLANLSFLKEDANRMSLLDESVDLVISRRGPDPEKEIFRILKNEGVFVFITIGELDANSLKSLLGRGQHYGSSSKVSDELKSKFQKSGFDEVWCHEFFYHDDYKSSDDLKEFLHQVPIFDNFSELDYPLVDSFCKNHEEDNIKLERHRVVLFAKKST